MAMTLTLTLLLLAALCIVAALLAMRLENKMITQRIQDDADVYRITSSQEWMDMEGRILEERLAD